MSGYIYRGIPPSPEPVFDPSKCGTPAGYEQHRRHGQERCRNCLDAYNVYRNAWREKKRKEAA